MNTIWRVIDANINRIAEGLRILEDLARFTANPSNLCSEIRQVRHTVRKSVKEYHAVCLHERDAINDPGISVSFSNTLDQKESKEDLIRGNFKRVQEGLRVVEECLKTQNLYDKAKLYERQRFLSYSIEKKFPRRKTFPRTDIYCLTAEKFSHDRSNIFVVEEMIKAGVKIIQYREKTKSGAQKYAECITIRKLTKDARVTFIVNDNIDLALMVEADGIHIGQDDYPLTKVRKLVGEDMIIGLSTHSPEQAMDAEKLGADYIGVGPIFPTSTKEDVCAPVGLPYLEYVVENISIPFVAIGGIKKQNIKQIAAAGATCAAIVTDIVGAENIATQITEFKQLMNKG